MGLSLIIITKGGFLFMGIVIIFFLVAILAAYGAWSALKNKNFLGFVFAAGSFVVFGGFALLTLINSGYPATH
jgi:Protein of unknown function (DUF2759)